MMEYEIWEEGLAPALTQIEWIAVQAELSQTIVSAEQESAGLCVWCGDTLLAKCTIAAGGEGVYSRYPQMRSVLENGQAVYVGESCTGDTLIYKKEEETFSCPVGLYIPEENAVELSARLATTSYHYDRYTIVTVVFADIPAIELWSGPVLYRELTGIEMAYSSADLLWTANTSPETVWQTLR